MWIFHILKQYWEERPLRTVRLFSIIFVICMVVSAIGFYLAFNQTRAIVGMRGQEYIKYSELLTKIVQTESKTIEANIVNNEGDTNFMSRIARRIVLDNGVIKGVQLAPGGIVERYAIDASKKLENPEVDLFADDRWSPGANWAVQNHDIAWLSMDGRCIALCPAYVPKNGGQAFWGFIMMDVDLQSFLTVASYGEANSSDLTYQFIYYEPWSHKGVTMMSSEEALTAYPMVKASDDGRLILRISKRLEWANLGIVANYILLAFLAAIFITIVAVLFHEMASQKRDFSQKAHDDPLTGIGNRRSFTAEVEELCKKGGHFRLYYIDLDEFKAVNDIYGHDIGDLLLIAVSKRLKNSIFNRGELFRLGGDEFVAVIPGTNDQETDEIMDSINDAFQEPFVFDALKLRVHCSCGCVRFPEEVQNLDQLLMMADKRMYEEKRRTKLHRSDSIGGDIL